MTRRHDVRKRRQWEERFERHRSGGLTVADFCAKERVSVNTFYYWAKRIDRHPTAARSAAAEAGITPWFTMIARALDPAPAAILK